MEYSLLWNSFVAHQELMDESKGTPSISDQLVTRIQNLKTMRKAKNVKELHELEQKSLTFFRLETQLSPNTLVATAEHLVALLEQVEVQVWIQAAGHTEPNHTTEDKYPVRAEAMLSSFEMDIGDAQFALYQIRQALLALQASHHSLKRIHQDAIAAAACEYATNSLTFMVRHQEAETHFQEVLQSYNHRSSQLLSEGFIGVFKQKNTISKVMPAIPIKNIKES